MPVTLPRSTWAWQNLANSRTRTLMTLFCLLCLAAGSPVQREAKMSQHQGLADLVKRSAERPAASFQADPTERGKLTWMNDGDNCFTQGGLTLKDNKLHVGQKGLYFVYAQLTFGGSECPPNDKNFISLSVILQSTVHNEPIQLFRADKTPCELAQDTSANKGNYTRRWNKSIFQGALFKLEKGDELYVKPTENKYLKMAEGANYFGAYAL